MSERLHPASYAQLQALVALHGAARVRQAIDERADTTAFYELQGRDVGKAHLRCFGHVWSVSHFLGQVLPGDVGKRVFKRGGILQVENDAQRAARLAR